MLEKQESAVSKSFHFAGSIHRILESHENHILRQKFIDKKNSTHFRAVTNTINVSLLSN